MKNSYKRLLLSLLLIGFSSQTVKANLSSEDVNNFVCSVAYSTPGRIVIGAAGLGILLVGLKGCQDHLEACYDDIKK